MGQFFTLAPVPAGFRCGRSDYGAAEVSSTRYPAYNPFFRIKSLVAKFPRNLKSWRVRHPQGSR